MFQGVARTASCSMKLLDVLIKFIIVGDAPLILSITMPPKRQHLIRTLFEDYIEMYAARDNRLTTCFSDNFSGYAGSSDVLVTDKTEWIRITRQNFAQVPERIDIEMLDLALQDLADDVVVATAFFHIHLPIPDQILSRETARLVLIFRNENGHWKIAHSGISIPYGIAHSGEIYPMTKLEERNQALERTIEKRTHELAEANRQLEVLSNTDGLTCVGNRRFFDKMLSQEWDRAKRSATPLSLLFLDIDHFKNFNDLYGHLAGDACLHALADAMSQVVRRAGDLIARYGGEEFVILLPNMDIHGALEIARHVHQAVLSLEIPHSNTPLGIVSVSIGVASLLPSNQSSPVELLEKSDKALYCAKSAGRNCIEVAQ